jgi:hypothetical protein
LGAHIFGYELKTCGRVLWGDSDLMSLAPAFGIANIPLEDGWRTMCNRLVELLAGVCSVDRAYIGESEVLRYKCVKLYLDMATSFLLFSKCYAPSYRERDRRLCCLVNRPQAEGTDWPFDATEFAAIVHACTKYKLSGVPLPNSLGGVVLLRSALEHAHRLWRWELAKLTGSDVANTPDHTLWMRWARLQNLRDKLRGWSFVARQRRFGNTWYEYPRWVRLSITASPRLWIYRAAIDVVFQLPALLKAADEQSYDESWQMASQWLPERLRKDALISWRHLAQEIVLNYELYLVPTRA